MNSMAVGYYYIPSESKILCMRLELKAVSFHAPSCVVCMFVPQDIHAKMKTAWVSDIPLDPKQLAIGLNSRSFLVDAVMPVRYETKDIGPT